MIPAIRRYAGIGLALDAVGVFPANIKHAIDTLSLAEVSAWQWGYYIVRLPMQPLLAWLALFVGGMFGRRKA